MKITELWREMHALPNPTGGEEAASTTAAAKDAAALAAEALETRYQQLADLAQKREAVFATQLREKNQELQNKDAQLAQITNDLTMELTEARRIGEEQKRKIALEAIRLMDALDWVQEALTVRGDMVADLSREMASAQRDCLRRLAAVGIEEIRADGRIDGDLHEGIEVAATETTVGIPRYHIVRVVRRGWRSGAEVLRRASVVTAG